MRKLIFIILFLPLMVWAQADKVPPTRYNWTNVANSITEGCTTDYERVQAIYRWICANISYDTSYSIYRADECWDNKRGVCQAYSELFYHIAKALDIRVDIISGRSKDVTGHMGDHAWVYAETDKARHAGVLVDPTWGAGSVINGVFKRKDNDMTWFHVNPYLMIFSHYPDEPSYQLLSERLSYEEFLRMPNIEPGISLYGIDEKEFFEHCRSNPSALPKFYSINGKAHFYIEEIPLLGTVRTGATYRFKVRKKNENFALICGDEFVYDKEWNYSNGIYTFDYTVPCENVLKLSWYDKRDDIYYTLLEYNIASPTATDMRNLEAKRPFAMPEIKRLEGVNKVYMEEMGFDGGRLLAAVRNGSVTCLPGLYYKEWLSVVDVPLNGVLRAGQSYRFLIKPKCSGKWAVINNKEWHYNWVKTPAGNMLEITVTPKSGILKISKQKEPNGSYYSCLEYKVR